MDGIFGVGLGELVVIVLVILIIGGPRNAVKWSREVGRMMRKLGQMYQELMREFEKELGPEAKEIMEVTRELTQNVNQVRNSTSPRRLAARATKLLDDTVGEARTAIKEAVNEADEAIKGKVTDQINQNTQSDPEATNGKYSDWLP